MTPPAGPPTDDGSIEQRAAARRPSARSAARLAAVQALYQLDIGGGGADAVVGEFSVHRLGHEVDGQVYTDSDPAMFAGLVKGVAAEAEELDDMIAAVLSDDLDVDRLETILRIILRAGAYELSTQLDVPARVTITEYVDVADAFYGRRETGLVNAVLDRLANELRPGELEGSAGGRIPAAR